MKKKRTGVLGLLGNLILCLFSFSCIFPMLWIFYSSFKTQAEFNQSSTALPQALDFTNYISVFTQTNLLTAMGNSFRNTILSVTGILILAFMAGYVLSRYRFRGRGFLYNYFTMGMLIPLHALLESYVKSIPRELEEAAAIDGCSFFKTMFCIVLPLASPILATVAIIQFFAVWNEFSFALILVSKDTLRTVPVGLTMFKAAYTVDYPRLMAGILVTMLPVMILYFSFSRRIIEGMTAGAVKG